MRAVGAEGECAGNCGARAGLCRLLKRIIHTIYQLSIDIHEVLVSELVRGGVAENGGPPFPDPKGRPPRLVLGAKAAPPAGP